MIVSSASCFAVAGLPSENRSRVSSPGSISAVSRPPTGRLGLLQPPQPPASALGMFHRMMRTRASVRPRDISSGIGANGGDVTAARGNLDHHRTPLVSLLAPSVSSILGTPDEDPLQRQGLGT